MFSRTVLSAVSLAALILVLVSCGGGQSTPVRTSPPTPTATTVPSLSSAPTPLSVPGPTSSLGSVPVLTPTPTSAPAPTPASAPTPTLSALPTAASTAAPTAHSATGLREESTPTFAPVPTPAPTTTCRPRCISSPTATLPAVDYPTPTPVSTQTSTPGPGASYLTAEIPPCTPVVGSSVAPCEPGWDHLVFGNRLRRLSRHCAVHLVNSTSWRVPGRQALSCPITMVRRHPVRAGTAASSGVPLSPAAVLCRPDSHSVTRRRTLWNKRYADGDCVQKRCQCCRLGTLRIDQYRWKQFPRRLRIRVRRLSPETL